MGRSHGDCGSTEAADFQPWTAVQIQECGGGEDARGGGWQGKRGGGGGGEEEEGGEDQARELQRLVHADRQLGGAHPEQTGDK